jgi:mono/diheme cytochrome c family protein
MHRSLAGRMRAGRLGTGCVAGLCLMLSACAPETTADGDKASAAADGAAVFAENCAVCHLSGRAPRLESIKSLPQAERGDRIRNHPRAGNLVDRLTADKLMQLVELIEASPPGTEQPEGPGAETFVTECGDCHGNGRGPAFSELSRLSSDQFRARLPEHPVAGAIPQRLTASQLGALIEFFDAK